MQYGYCLLNMQPFPVPYQFQPLSNIKEFKQPHHAVNRGIWDIKNAFQSNFEKWFQKSVARYFMNLFRSVNTLSL